MNICTDVEKAFLCLQPYPPEGFAGEYYFPDDHPIFSGHFPGAPLLPGVYLLQCLLSTAQRGLGQALEIRQVRNVKFQAPVRPPCRFTARVVCTRKEEGWVLKGEIIFREGLAASALMEAVGK